jgi:LPS-assembly protein
MQARSSWRHRMVFLASLLLAAPAFALPPMTFLPAEGALPANRVMVPTQDSGDTVVMSAEEMGMDEPRGIVIARGKVEVAQGDSILMADQIIYYQTTDLVIATGNVSLLQPNGDVLFAQKAELKDAMKRGIIRDFKARFADNSVLVAQSAIKRNSSVTELKRASYTPCVLASERAQCRSE